MRGTVRDPVAAVVPGATVTLLYVEKASVGTSTAKGPDFYDFTNVPPGEYRLTVEKQGFGKWG